MYRQPYGKSFRYTCGLYQQSHGQECAHNHIDGLTATRFVLSAIRQRLLNADRLRRLQAKITARAQAELGKQNGSLQLESKRSVLVQLRSKLVRVQRNLALADSDEQFQSISIVFTELKAAERQTESELAALERQALPISVEAEVAKALEIIPRLSELAANAGNLAALAELFGLMNVQLYFRFRPVQKKRRIENKVSGGVLAWGNADSPIEKYAGPTSRRLRDHATQQINPTAAGGSGVTDVIDSGGRDESLGNVSRGDRI